MTTVMKRLTKGVVLKGEATDVTENLEGSLWQNSATARMKTYIEAAVREVVTNDQAQVLTNKTIDADLNTITNIENADIKAGAAIDASKIADGSVSNAEFQHLGTVTSNIQSQLDNKVNGPASATDNAIARFDATTGKLVQDSVGILSDTGVLTGLTGITSSGTSSLSTLTTSGATLNTNNVADAVATGANATIAAPAASTSVIRLTNASLTSVSGLTQATAGRQFKIVNNTGATISFNHEDTVNVATATSRFTTVTGLPVKVLNGQHIEVYYNTTIGRHAISTSSADLAASKVTNVPSGNLAATDVQSALNELQSDIDTRASDLTAHLTDAVDAHDASAISSIPSGNLAATEVQAALNELQSDIDTRALDSALTAHLTDTVDAHDASAISVVPSGNLAATDVQAALSELQTDIDARVVGPASATDNALARFDLTTGKIIQNSVGILSDAGILTGLTGLTSSGTVTSSGTLAAAGSITESFSTDAATTGSNANVASPATPAVRLTNASLASIDTILSPVAGRVITLVNHSGNTVTVNNDTGATAANRILTGTKAAIQLADEASLILKYDSTDSRWLVIGGTGSSIAALDADVMAIQNFENSSLTDFTQTGLVLDTTTQIHGANSAKLIHQAAINQSFKQTIAVNPKFRGAAMTVQLSAKSAATSGNLVIQFRDETNAVNLQSSQLINATSAIQTFQFGVLIPATCLSFSYTITALPEAGSPVSYIDDIVIRNYWQGSALTGQSTVSVPTVELQTVFHDTPTTTFGSTNTGVPVLSTPVNTGSSLLNVVSNSTDGTSWVALKKCIVEINSNINVTSGSASIYVTKNSTVLNQTLPTGRIARQDASTVVDGISASVNMEIGDILRLQREGSNVTSFNSTSLNAVAVSSTEIVTTDLVPASSMPANASISVPVVTSWTSYTPTFTGFGTPTSVAFQWRQVGENAEIRGTFAAGTVTAVEARVGLPNGLLSKTNIAPLEMCGNFAVNNIYGYIDSGVAIEPNVSYVTFVNKDNATNGFTKKTANLLTLNVGTLLSFHATVPCAGLSATETKTWSATQAVVTSNGDSMIRLNGTNGFGSPGSRVRRFSSITQSIGSDVSYNDSATNGGSFTILTSGTYAISFSEYSSQSVTNHQVGISKNASSLSTDISSLTGTEVLAISGDALNSAAAAARYINAAWTGYLTAGDVIRAQTDSSTGDSASSSFTIAKQGSLSLVQTVADQKIKIPTSELRFEGASARGAVATGIVKFDTLVKIKGDAFTVTNTANDGTYVTMTKAGILSVNASLALQAAANSNMQITKNQVTLTGISNTFSEVMNQSGSTSSTLPRMTSSWTGSVVIGDVFRITSNQTPTNDVSCSFNLSFQEQDIAVSVTNVLPQFSDSDSSVRVDTANGYGSTATKIRRFSNVRDNIGSDILYEDSATNGSSFTVMESGSYNVSYSENGSVAMTVGLSKNASSLTTSIESLAAEERLAISTTGITSGYSETVSWEGYLSAGSIIRAHTDGAASGVAARTTFTISKVGKPNVTGVDVTPFISVPQNDIFYTFGMGNAGQAITAGVTDIPFITMKNDLGSWNGSTYTVKKEGLLTVTGSMRTSVAATNLSAQLFKNGVSYKKIGIDFGSASIVPFQFGEEVKVGDVFSIRSNNSVTLSNNADDHWINFNLQSKSDQILTAPETFSTDTAPLVYAGSSTYTLATLNTAPVGTFITYTYAGSTNTRTQTTTAPTQTTADMNTNGIRVFTRAYATLSTAANPVVIAIQIGKGLKGLSMVPFQTTGKTLQGNLDSFVKNTTVEYGFHSKDYNETTGILLLDGGFCLNTTTTNREIQFTDTTTASAAYVVVNASKNPALVGVPLLQPRFATISDVRASGTSAGGTTAGTFITRTLNTLEDPNGIVTSLTANQFVLPAGTYYVEGSAPAGSCGEHKVKLRNITDSTDQLIGSSEYAIDGLFSYTRSNFSGEVIITAAKTFELQHRATATQATDGLGHASGMGVNEVYAILKITKVK